MRAVANRNLIDAKNVKNDEFYTKYEDIAEELQWYIPYLRNKVVYCNCDNPQHSNFYKYFLDNFRALGLKKLIATSVDGIGAINDKMFKLQNGDFRSPECLDFLMEADVVITNPPFSLFREFISLMMKFNKKFLVLGSMNAIATIGIFDLILKNRLWLGASNKTFSFITPDETESKFNNIRWFTNIDYSKRHEPLNLTKRYNSAEYPTYDNFNAIEVSAVKNIPIDYDGVMGVPISFLDKYNPDQFEIVGNEKTLGIPRGRGYVNGKRLYSRIFIRHKTPMRGYRTRVAQKPKLHLNIRNMI